MANQATNADVTKNSEAELRSALGWVTDTPAAQAPPDKPVYVWLWEAIQGDFNDDRSVGQIAFDTGISMIPIVDQICDVRDIIANCKKIDSDKSNHWAWVALVLTLIGLFPSLGSLVKGVLKIFFLFIRRMGADNIAKAVDLAMTWVITLLRKREVQQYLKKLKVEQVFKWLADEIKVVRGKLNTQALLTAFDKVIGIMNQLLNKVSNMPFIGAKAKAVIAKVKEIRMLADSKIGQAVAPVQKALDAIIKRLELEHLAQHHGILNTGNIHFRGGLPEARAVTLMRRADPLPSWLSKGRTGKWPAAPLIINRGKVEKKVKDGYPTLTDTNITSFHRLAAIEIKGPAKLYRITSPSNGAMGDCWIPEDLFHKIMASPDPKAAWRKHFAVWPDWNPNGQFVIYEIPRGETIKAWRGPASSQVKEKEMGLNAHLEGGWDQIIIKPKGSEWDSTRYYMRGGGNGEKLHPPGISRDEWSKFSKAKQKAYTPIREQINSPNIQGPFDTKWGSTDFDTQLRDAKIGLPSLPGQVSNTLTR